MPKLSKEEIKAFLRENMGIPEVPEEMLEATSDLISIVIGDEGTSMHASAVQHICENIETVESLQKKLLKVASSPRPKGEFNFVITAEEFSVITASFVTALQDKTRFLKYIKNKKDEYESVLNKVEGYDKSDPTEPDPLRRN